MKKKLVGILVCNLVIVATVFMVVVTTNVSATCPEGMISYWKFDEGSGTTAMDSVDDNPGTFGLAGPGPVWTDGIVDGALSFDGINGYVNIDGVSDYLKGKTALTFELWVNISDNTDINFIALDEVAPRTTILATLAGIGSGRLRLYISGWWNFVTSSSVIPLNTPTHLAATYDAGTIRLYINGVEDNSGTVTPTVLPDIVTYDTIGACRNGNFPNGISFVTGMIDEVAIYDRALTPGEIQQHYNYGLAGFGYCGPAGATEDVVEDVEELDLPVGVETALTSTLDAAINSLDNGQTTAAINQLNAFINQVEAQRGNKLTDEEADALVNATQQIIDAINSL